MCLYKHAYSQAGMESLSTYLKKRGLTKDSPLDFLQAAKKEHRRLYQKEYQSNRKKKILRLGVSLTPTEYRRLSRTAKEHGLKTGSFIRKAALAYTEQKFLLPDDATVLALELGIRRVGLNINQVVRHIHEKKTIEELDIDRINALLIELEDTISYAFRNPPQAE